MASKDTGFHPSDPDWTRGRAQAIGHAETIARRQIGMMRKVTLAQPSTEVATKPDLCNKNGREGDQT